MVSLRKIKFNTYLGIISILGYTSILVQSAFSIDISGWVDSLLFVLIGISLFISGGYNLIFNYFKGGLTVNEINKIVAVVVGFASIVTGVLTLPIFGINVDVFDGFKIIISGVAILVILSELLFEQNRVK